MFYEVIRFSQISQVMKPRDASIGKTFKNRVTVDIPFSMDCKLRYQSRNHSKSFLRKIEFRAVCPVPMSQLNNGAIRALWGVGRYTRNRTVVKLTHWYG